MYKKYQRAFIEKVKFYLRMEFSKIDKKSKKKGLIFFEEIGIISQPKSFWMKDSGEVCL